MRSIHVFQIKQKIFTRANVCQVGLSLKIRFVWISKTFPQTYNEEKNLKDGVCADYISGPNFF